MDNVIIIIIITSIISIITNNIMIVLYKSFQLPHSRTAADSELSSIFLVPKAVTPYGARVTVAVLYTTIDSSLMLLP
jgi:hypothetical protein